MKTKRNSSRAHSPVELFKEMQDLVAEAQSLMADTASGAAHEGLEAVRNRLAAVRERLSAVYETERERVIAGARRADETIRTHPYQAIAVAAGIGLLVGALMSRRSR